MIIAVSKLISCPQLKKLGQMLILLGLFILGLLASSAEASPTVKEDASFAKIVISSTSYSRAKAAPSKSTYQSLPEIAKRTMYRHFGMPLPEAAAGELKHGSASTLRRPALSLDADCFNSLKVEAKFMQPAAVFVTLSKNGKTRACWGSVYPREANIARETVLATLGALSKEYRFKPIRKNELKDLKIQVTVIRSLEAVSNVKQINPYKDGLMVRSGGRSGVILPGEATDAYYEFVLARLKAGIQPKDPCQIYKIRADIYD